MNKYSLMLFISSAIWTFLGIKILLNEHRNKHNVLFFLICMSLVIFQLFLGLGNATTANGQHNIHRLMLIKIAYIGIYIFFPLNLHFYLILSKTKIKEWMLIICYAPAIILNMINFIGYSIYSDIFNCDGVLVGVFEKNIWLYLFILYVLLFFVISLFVILRWRKKTKINKEKIYSKYILAAYSVFYFCGLLLTILLPLFGIYAFQGIGHIGFYLYFIGLYYLILKFRFMNNDFSLMADEIISNLNEVVLLLDQDMKIIHVNRSFEQIFSISPGKAINRFFYDLIVRYDTLNKYFLELIHNKKRSFSARLDYKKDDEYVITQTFISRIEDKFGDFIGFFVISSEVREIKQFQRYFKITNRELEIIELIIAGSTYKDTADVLCISEKTVETHLTNIYNKLGINNKIELIRITGDFNIKPFPKEKPAKNANLRVSPDDRMMN